MARRSPSCRLPSSLAERMLKTPGGDREMVEILALVLITTSRPCSPRSNWRWNRALPTKPHILNLLHRLVDGKPADTPP